MKEKINLHCINLLLLLLVFGCRSTTKIPEYSTFVKTPKKYWAFSLSHDQWTEVSKNFQPAEKLPKGGLIVDVIPYDDRIVLIPSCQPEHPCDECKAKFSPKPKGGFSEIQCDCIRITNRPDCPPDHSGNKSCIIRLGNYPILCQGACPQGTICSPKTIVREINVPPFGITKRLSIVCECK